MERNLTTLTLLLLFSFFLCPQHILAQDSDFGMWYELGAEKKLTPHWTVGAEGEFRTRNNTRTADRWSAGASAEYKIMKGLKASAGYTLLYDNNREELDLKKDGVTPNKWTPSYWAVRHRFNLSLAGSTSWNRFTLALRQRWQYTYRPEASGKKYDIDNDTWKSIRGKGKNVSRTRLQMSYDIAHCKIDPFANAEMFVDKSGIQKMRYQAGANYKYDKKNIFSLTYRYQNVNSDDDDGDVNTHLIGLSYKHKF